MVLSLPPGWIFISHQSELRTSTKIFTHNSMPGTFCPASAVDLVGNQLCMHDPVFWKYFTQQVRLSTRISNKYSHCLGRWVGLTYLLPFHVSVDMFLLGCRVELPRFAPFFGSNQIPAKNSQTTSRHYLFYPSFPLNKYTPQIIWSIQNSLILLFNLQQLKMRSELWIRDPLPQVCPYHSFSHQLFSSNPFSLPDVMTYQSNMSWRDSWRSDWSDVYFHWRSIHPYKNSHVWALSNLD